MEWLNLHVAVLDSPEFVGSDPVERATWLCLIRYAIGQENGGNLRAARTWKDRQWQQLCKVTLREVQNSCRLFQWDGDDLILFGYPTEKEAEVRAKREAGRETAAKRWSAKARSANSSVDSSAISSATSLATPPATCSATAEQPQKQDAEGKGREGNNTQTCATRDVLLARFEQFWRVYPRKVGKGKAREAWIKAKPSESLTARILAAVAAQVQSEQWQKDAGRFIPHPSTWLHQERWDDEPETVADPDPPEWRNAPRVYTCTNPTCPEPEGMRAHPTPTCPHAREVAHA